MEIRREFIDKPNSDSDAYISYKVNRNNCTIKIADCTRSVNISFEEWKNDDQILKKAKFLKFKAIMLDFFEETEKQWID